MPIVLVYLGRRLPIYAALNLRYLKRNFPSREVWLVSDNAWTIWIGRLLGVHVFQCTDAATSWAHVRDKTPLRIDFRKGFWFLTLARLYSLSEFAKAVDPGPFLHVESDVWLSPRFPFDELAAIDALFAFPLEAERAGVASTLYVRSADAMAAMVAKVEEWIAAGETFTDMGFLGALVDRNALPLEVLPSAPESLALFRDGVSDGTKALITTTVARGIFDGMAWGWDLTGEDPRNHWGTLRLFQSHYASAIETNRARIGVGADGLPVVIDNQGVEYRLHSLHVHSKDWRMFIAPRRRLAQRVEQRNRGGQRSVWLPQILLGLLWSQGIPWIRRRLPSFIKRG